MADFKCAKENGTSPFEHHRCKRQCESCAIWWPQETPKAMPTVYLYADDDDTPWRERGFRVWRSPQKRPKPEAPDPHEMPYSDRIAGGGWTPPT